MAQLTINSANGDLWHGGNFYCSLGATCETVSANKTVNMLLSSITSDGEMKQQSASSYVKLQGSVSGKGSYSASAPGNVGNYGLIDVNNRIQLEAGENLENSCEARINSKNGSTIFKGKNINQDGKVNTGGKFAGEAQKAFVNTGEMNSEKGFSAKTGEKFENAKEAIIVNKGNETEIKSTNSIINSGSIDMEGNGQLETSKTLV